jgi:tellurite resistance protein TerC
MDSVQLFPLAEYWWLYLAFMVGVVVVLFIDLGVFHRDAHVVSIKEAGIWVSVWISLALLFNVGLYQFSLWKFGLDPRLLAIPGFDPAAEAWRVALEFLTGYVVEKSLSVDNIFVFVVVFKYFGIPDRYQHRVLFYGIMGAFIFRTLFIVVGSVLMQYQSIVYLFGAFLIFTGIRLAYAPEEKVDPEKNTLIRIFRRFVPVTPSFHGQKFFVRLDGVMYGTPLVVALIFLEATDIVFAVDSVPAVFAISSEPLIVFTSNLSAILGLRAIYFLLAGALDKFHLLKYGLAVVLIFVGLKMVWLNDLYDGHFPIGVSLGFIAGVLVLSTTASLIWPQNDRRDVTGDE